MKRILIFILLQVANNLYSQQPIYLSTLSQNLYQLNLTNCTYSLIGSSERMMSDIAVTPDDRLWGIWLDSLYQIDITNGSLSLVGKMGIGGNALVELSDSLLLTTNAGLLYTVNVNDASTNIIGDIGFDSQGDFTWYEDYLCLISSNGTLVKILLNDSNTEVISTEEIDSIPFANAAVTTSLLSSINTIACFDQNQLYDICPFGGPYNLICEILPLEESAAGAASKRLPFQNPTPTNCLVLNNQDNKIKKTISTYPNPVSRDGVLTIDLENDFNGTLSLQIKNNLGNIILSTNLDFENGLSLSPNLTNFMKTNNNLFNQDNCVYQHSLNIDQPYQRQGWGEKLKHECHNIIKDHGYQYATNIVKHDNIGSQKLMNKLGYKKHQSNKERDMLYLEL
jgi:hypothetical protein